MRSGLLGVLVAGCAGGSTAPVVDGSTTWHADVRPIVDRACLDCHDDGGIGPIVLRVDDAASDAPDWAPIVAASVAAGRMPPWDASDDCHPIAGSRALTDAERAAFAAWEANGFAVGDPATYAAADALAAPVDPGPPDLTLDAGAAYTPDRARPDDYHCLPLGPPSAEARWLRGITVLPDVGPMVHHAIVYLVPPEQTPVVAARDAAEPGPGYRCFGGPASDGALDATNLHTWLPGSAGEQLPADEGRALPAGSQLVLQVHYNTLGYAADTPIPADRSAVALWLHDRAPPFLIETVGLSQTEFLLPPGDPSVAVGNTMAFGVEAEIVAMTPHMHQLGRSLRVSTRGPAGDRCVVDVPDWDFDWQQTYRFDAAQPFVLDAADEVVLTCVYDNSAANQPVIDGVRQEPRAVTWGEGTLDEMCLAYAHVRVPAGGAGQGGVGCPRFDAILDDCPADDGGCWLDGVAAAVRACGGCPVEALGACRADACVGAFVPLGACLASCPDPTTACLTGACAAQAEAYLACLGPEVRAGTCDPWLASCGIVP